MPARRKKPQKASKLVIFSRAIAIFAGVLFVTTISLTGAILMDFHGLGTNDSHRTDSTDPQKSLPAGRQEFSENLASEASSQIRENPQWNNVLVTYVYDGDTIKARGLPQSLRLIGIDAPEVYNAYEKTEAECGSGEAKKALKAMVDDKEVVLARPEGYDDKDRFGRLLRYVYVCDNIVPPTAGLGEGRETLPYDETCSDTGLELIRQGWAEAFSFGNEHPREEIYRQAQNEAKEAGRGMWGICR